MPGVSGPNLGVKFGWIDHENGWGGDMNSNLRGLDDLVQLAVADKDLATPPGSPTEGVRYIVAASPTGAWTGHAGQIARWVSAGAGAWIFYVPKEGWLAWASDENVVYGYTGSAWTSITAGGGGFAVLAGQAGGQVLNGGTAAGENLELHSTAHATKGLIKFGSSSAYDEVNIRLGIGTLAPQASLHVGTNTHASGAAGDAIIEGRIMSGDNQGTGAFVSGLGLSVNQNAVNGGTLSQIRYNMAALSGAASGTLTLMNVSTTGIPGYTSGSFSILGLSFNPTFTVPSGVTVTSLVGVDSNYSFGTTAGGAITTMMGYRSVPRGPASAGPTLTNLYGYYSSPGWRGNMQPTLVAGYAVTKDTLVTYGPGPVTSAYGYYIDSSFAAAGAVTTWYGYYVPTITGPGTIWGFYQAGTMNSAFGGKTRFGSTATPAHWIDAAAGTTTVAFMRAASGSLLTTATAGCFEYDGTRLYFTDGTPTRQTVAFISDGTGGGTLTHNLLSSTHPDTNPGTVVRGDMVVGNATPKWDRVAIGANRKFWGSDGTDPSWKDLPAGCKGGVTVSKFYPAMLFKVASIDPTIRSGGSDTEYVGIPFADNVDRIAAGTVEIPADYGSGGVWKLWYTQAGTASGQVRWRFGVSNGYADAGQADNTKTSNNNDVAAIAVNNKIKALAVDMTGFPSLVAATPVGIRVSRPGATDTINDTCGDAMQFLLVELQYTRAD